jgi:hypothetical protein
MVKYYDLQFILTFFHNTGNNIEGFADGLNIFIS